MILNTILRNIEGEFILNIDGMDQKCENGVEVLDTINSDVVYAIQKISVKDGKVYIKVCDQTEVIVRKNTAWMEAEKTRTGIEVSFF